MFTRAGNRLVQTESGSNSDFFRFVQTDSGSNPGFASHFIVNRLVETESGSNPDFFGWFKSIQVQTPILPPIS